MLESTSSFLALLVSPRFAGFLMEAESIGSMADLMCTPGRSTGRVSVY
jgi:hypothetical protein